MRLHRLGLAILALAVVAFACGGDDDTGPTSQAPATTAAPAATTMTPTTPAPVPPTMTPTTPAPAATTMTPTTAASATTVDAGSEPRVLQIGAEDSEGFSTSRLAMKAGETVTVVFNNQDTASGEPHNWHVSLPSGEVLTPLSVGPDTNLVTFTVDQPGEYPFICDTHLTAMFGTLVVEP